MPPSTDTYTRSSIGSPAASVVPAGRCTGLIVPTRYSVTPAGATIQRPGSKEITGEGMPSARLTAVTASARRCSSTSISIESSPSVYATE